MPVLHANGVSYIQLNSLFIFKLLYYRLDLYNAIGEYGKNATENDAILVVAYNTKDGDLMVLVNGDVSILSAAVSDRKGDFVKFMGQDEVKGYLDVQNAILNMAVNILRQDKELRTKMKIAIDFLE